MLPNHRSKYFVDPKDPNSLIRVEIRVDCTGEDFRVIPDSCVFSQGIGDCNGNPLVPCHGKYERCNNHTKELCTDEYGRLNFVAKEREEQGQNNSTLPNGIVTEWALFSRENYGIRSYIHSMSSRIDKETNKRVFDQYRYDQYCIKALLKQWSLGDIRPELNIQPVQIPEVTFTVISDDQMRSINRIAGDIIDAFLSKFRKAVSGRR